MKKDRESEVFDNNKMVLQNVSKDLLIEYLAALLLRLSFSGVTVRLIDTPNYIENVSEIAEYRKDKTIIDFMRVDFSEHDKLINGQEVRNEEKND